MAIIYTYPTKATPVLADLVLITDTESTNPSNQTKTIALSSIKDTIDVVDSIVAGSGITVSGATGAVTITNAGVKSLVSANEAIVASSSGAGGTGALTITSTPYTGDTNIGHVPSGSGGSSTAFLNGAGDWATPTNTTYTAGDGLDLTGTTFSTDLKANGGLVIESTELALDLGASSITGVLAASNGGVGTGTQNAIAFWNTTTALGSSIITQPSANQINIAANANSTAATLQIPTSTASGPNASLGGVSLTGGVYNVSQPNISPAATTGIIQFGSQLNGQVFDFRNNKIAFDSDATNTYIKSDSVNPESLQIHADQEIQLNPDQYLVYNHDAAAPTNADDSGNVGSIAWDQNYLYICIEDDVWKRVALSSW